MKLYTGRYKHKQIADSGLVPVGITLGVPKFPLPYQVVEYVRELAPDGWMFQINDRAAFTPKFYAKLDRIGVEKIRRQLERISREHGGRDLVLLCYEDVSKPREWCHRLVFAEWWGSKTGEKVEELDLLYPPDKGSKTVTQLTFSLF
ncbi:MAG: hypothetical protein C4570_06475 [Ammonifex sp.]|nr:MAG: hypothetical protein C4570_06475 [Ammonifex sp.]